MRSNPRNHGVARLLVSLVTLAALTPPAHAQGTGRSTDIDVSIRSAALGGASDALFWGEERDHWANPALLGYERGVRFEHGRTQLVPGLASDIVFTSDVVKIGGGGIGVVLSRPPGPHGVDLDYGTSEGTDGSGNPTGTFDSYERVRSWGVGLSALQALDALLGTGGRSSRLSRYGDLSFGVNFKDVKIALAPVALGGEAATSARDYGVLARVTPYDGLAAAGGPPIRVDLAYGYSRLNANDDAVIRFVNEDITTHLTRQRRGSFALHVAADPRLAPVSDRAWDAIVAGFSPWVSLGMATGQVTADGGPGTREFTIDGNGFEITLARSFSYRWGHYRDVTGDIDGSTGGFSIGLPIGPWGGGYYEEARLPQARDSGLPDLHRKAFGVWLDPIAMWDSAHGRRPARRPAPAPSTPIPMP